MSETPPNTPRKRRVPLNFWRYDHDFAHVEFDKDGFVWVGLSPRDGGEPEPPVLRLRKEDLLLEMLEVTRTMMTKIRALEIELDLKNYRLALLEGKKEGSDP